MQVGVSTWYPDNGLNAPAFDANLLSGTLPSNLTATRASSGGRCNPSGVYELVGTDVARIDTNPATLAPRGLLMEGPRTNYIRNSENLGTPGSGDNTSSTAYSVRGGTATQTTDPKQGVVFLFTEDTNSNSHALISPRGDSPASTETRTNSVSLKAGTASRVAVTFKQSFLDTNDAHVKVDLASGTIIGAVTGPSLLGTYGIADEGGGWYRVWYGMSMSNTTGFRSVTVQTMNGSDQTVAFTGTGRTFYYSRPQQETGSFPSSYIPTSTLNMLLNSDDFSTTWARTNSNVSTNTTTAPDGTLTADSLNDNATNNNHLITQNVAILSGTTYTFSVSLKANTQSWIQLSLGSASFGGAPWYNVNLSTGAIGNSGGSGLLGSSVTDEGDGWYRCSITATATATSGTGTSGVIILTNGTNAATRAPTFVGAGNGVYVCRGQFQVGSAPTTYIPTTSASSATTRARDLVTFNNLSGINLSSGTWVFEVEIPAGAEQTGSFDPRLIHVGNTTDSWGVAFNFANNRMRLTSVASSSTVVDINTANNSAPYNAVAKVAVRVAANNWALCVNGGTVVTDTVSGMPTLPAAARIGSRDVSTGQITGWFRDIEYYTALLPDNQLQALTS